jgi:hypothetical protein
VRAIPLLILGLAAACTHAVADGSDPPGDASQPPGATPGAAKSPAAGNPGADASTSDPPADPPPSDDPPATNPPPTDDVPGDDNGDGVVNVSDAGPSPADAHEACAEWTDCAPHFDDPNSGFDCVDSACTCDSTGQWAQACAGMGGSWSSFECFCFTHTDTVMPTAAPETPEQADEGVTCWWTWRLRYCDPDRWIDTSYYERVCQGDDCWEEYVPDGYYEDGECYGRWIKRCTDGNEYWY